MTGKIPPIETAGQAKARTVTSPEVLSASVLTICRGVDKSQINDMVGELAKKFK